MKWIQNPDHFSPWFISQEMVLEPEEKKLGPSIAAALYFNY